MAENNWTWDLSSTFDVANMIGDYWESYYNYLAQKETNETNYQIFREGLDWNRPINQMVRFKEAGLNPNLIYTQGNAGNATAVPTMKAPQLNLDFTQKLSTIYGIKNLREQNKNLQEQNKNLATQRSMVEVDIRNGILDGLLKSSQNYLLKSQASAQEQNAKRLELENAFFKKHGYWPSQEGSFFRGARSLLPNIGRGYFNGVETLNNIWTGFVEGLGREANRLKSQSRFK